MSRSGSVYCFIHDPDSAAERQAARIKGGKERSRKAVVLPAGTADASLASAADVTRLLGETINHLRRGELDPRICSGIAYLATVLLKAKQHDEVEQRLARLEAILADQQKAKPTLDSARVDFTGAPARGQA